MTAGAVPRKPWYRRIRWWGWVLIAIAAVMVVFAGTVGTQALLVKHHEEAAIAVVKDAVKKHRLNDLDGVVADMQKRRVPRRTSRMDRCGRSLRNCPVSKAACVSCA